MASKQATVLIAGGSVAGLALANMLEQVGIDYLVLEKYGQIAPQLGASIAITATGARILDQLGCYDGIQDILNDAKTFDRMTNRSADGKDIWSSPPNGVQQAMVKKWGYGFVFLDRQTLLQQMFANVRGKSRILTNKGVVRVEEIDDGVRVHTADGDTFTGQILVGADGVHSTVRREMWRIADEQSPDYFPQNDRTDASCDYICCFGISEAFPAFERRSVQVEGNNYSYLISCGPTGKTYWFLFSKLDKTIHGLYDKLPRYSDQDRDELVKKHFDDQIFGDLRFKDLWDCRISATLTALPEFVLSKWHYGRIITVGDAAHKFNPITGAGGNSAIETCAVLTNHLHRLLKSRPAEAPLTQSEITHAFSQVQSIRHKRVQDIKAEGHLRQSMQARETWKGIILSRAMVPFMNTDMLLRLMSQNWKKAVRLEMLELKKRPTLKPFFEDEMPVKSIGEKGLWWAVYAAVASSVVAAAVRYVGPSVLQVR